MNLFQLGWKMLTLPLDGMFILECHSFNWLICRIWGAQIAARAVLQPSGQNYAHMSTCMHPLSVKLPEL